MLEGGLAFVMSELALRSRFLPGVVDGVGGRHGGVLRYEVCGCW